MKTKIYFLSVLAGALIMTSCQKQPVASFTTDKTTYTAGETVKLTNTSTDGDSYLWTFPDGTTGTVASYDYTLNVNDPDGTQTFKLKALSKNGKKSNETSKSITVNAAPGINITTVQIPGGTFTMGSPTTEVNHETDETQYQVTLTAFKMSKYEITNAQYAAFLNAKSIGSNGLYPAGTYPTQALIYASSGSYDWGLHYTAGQWVPATGYENNPVIYVTWYGAAEFASYAGGSLPTEAQWEYACRGNTTTPLNTGNCLSDAQANYDWAYPYNTCTNTNTTYPGKTQTVGTYTANAYGLSDMHGNVWEWCSDWYGTYPTTAQTNPTGAVTGSNRVIRGGSWIGIARHCRSALRNSNYPTNYNYDLGFRLVLP